MTKYIYKICSYYNIDNTEKGTTEYYAPSYLVFSEREDLIPVEAMQKVIWYLMYNFISILELDQEPSLHKTTIDSFKDRFIDNYVDFDTAALILKRAYELCQDRFNQNTFDLELKVDYSDFEAKYLLFSKYPVNESTVIDASE